MMMQCIFSMILKKLYIRRPITVENSILSSLLIPFCGTCMNWSPRHYPCDCSYLCLGYFDIFFITGRSIFTYCGCTCCSFFFFCSIEVQYMYHVFCFLLILVNELVQKVKERTGQKKSKMVLESQVKIFVFWGGELRDWTDSSLTL